MTLTGCELSGNNGSAQTALQTENEGSENTAKSIPSPTAAVSVMPTSTAAVTDSKETASSASAAKSEDSTQNRQSENNSDSETSGSNDSTQSSSYENNIVDSSEQEDDRELYSNLRTVTLVAEDGSTFEVHEMSNGDYQWRDDKELGYNSDDEVYFTDEYGNTYQALNDNEHYFGTELEQHTLSDGEGGYVTVTQSTNGDYLWRDDSGTGYTDNGDGSWTDENGNIYTE